MGIRQALTRNRAETRPDATDPKLRGRAYAIPFARVWEEAVATALATRGWVLTGSNAGAGTIEAEARTLLWRFTDDVAIRISLDDKGLTRVDVASASRVGRADLGANARRIARFLHALDGRLRPAGGGRAQPNR